MGQFKRGDTAYIVESERFVRKGKIMKCTGGLYLLKFDGGGGTYVKEHRLYDREQDAQEEIARIHMERANARYYGDLKLYPD